jgi:hypothetical protein
VYINESNEIYLTGLLNGHAFNDILRLPTHMFSADMLGNYCKAKNDIPAKWCMISRRSFPCRRSMEHTLVYDCRANSQHLTTRFESEIPKRFSSNLCKTNMSNWLICLTLSITSITVPISCAIWVPNQGFPNRPCCGKGFPIVKRGRGICLAKTGPLKE